MDKFDKIPEVIRSPLLYVQICIPEDWTDEQALEFVETEKPSGLSLGWQIHKQEEGALGGACIRAPCDQKDGFVHVVFSV